MSNKIKKRTILKETREICKAGVSPFVDCQYPSLLEIVVFAKEQLGIRGVLNDTLFLVEQELPYSIFDRMKEPWQWEEAVGSLSAALRRVR